MYETTEIDLIFKIFKVIFKITISIFKYSKIALYYILYILINILDFFDNKYDNTFIKTLLACIVIYYLIKLWFKFCNYLCYNNKNLCYNNKNSKVPRIEHNRNNTAW